jgi:hypothetical protein
LVLGRIRITSLIVLVSIFVFVLASFFLSDQTARTYETSNYITFLGLLITLAFTLKKDALKFVFSPSFIAVAYLNINFFLGSYLFKNDLVFKKLLPDYELWEFYDTRIIFFNCANFAILISYFFKAKFGLKTPTLIRFNKISKPSLLFISAILLLLIAPFQFPFATIPKSILAIVLFILIRNKYKVRKRILYYFLILLLLALVSTHSKRDAIFLILPILLLEMDNLKLKVSFKAFIRTAVVVFFVVYAVVAMSILRGYGGYKADNFPEASTYVFDYISSGFFVPAIANNLEISYTYLHSNNIIEYLNRGKMDYTKGETFIKPFFIFVPSSIIEKPKNSIGYYTETYDKEFRDEGGSYPVSLQSEFYLNFGMFSLILIFPFFLFCNSIYKYIIALVKSNRILDYFYLLYGYLMFLTLVRGSGLDIFTVYILILILLSFVYKVFIKTLLFKVNEEKS